MLLFVWCILIILLPILAALKTKPKGPFLFLSTNPGAAARIYVHVQIDNRITSKSDEKLNKADCSDGDQMVIIV